MQFGAEPVGDRAAHDIRQQGVRRAVAAVRFGGQMAFDQVVNDAGDPEPRHAMHVRQHVERDRVRRHRQRRQHELGVFFQQ